MRTIITSATRPESALELAPGVYEVMEAAYVVVDAKGEPVKDEGGKPAMATGYLLPDGAAEVAREERAAKIPHRWDLDARHPLRGYRVLAAGYSGDSDRVMGEDGEVYPASEIPALVAAGTVKRGAEPKPVEKPLEDGGEVTRVR